MIFLTVLGGIAYTLVVIWGLLFLFFGGYYAATLRNFRTEDGKFVLMCLEIVTVSMLCVGWWAVIGSHITVGWNK